MSKKILTVGIPLYNDSEYFEEALLSLLNQTYKNFDIVISDNGSTDGVENIYKRYLDDERVKIIKHKKNLGAFYNFEFLYEQCKTPYFMWFSSHDVLDPTYIEKNINFLINHQDYILSASKVRMIDENNNDLGLKNDYTYNTYSTKTPFWRYFYSIYDKLEAGFIHGIFVKEKIDLEFYKTHGSDDIMLSHFMYKGKLNLIEEELFFRRYFTERKEDYMKRLFNKKIKRDNFSLYKSYMKNFSSLYEGNIIIKKIILEPIIFFALEYRYRYILYLLKLNKIKYIFLKLWK